MGNAVKRSIKGPSAKSYVLYPGGTIVKGGVVPSEQRVQFSAYKVPGKGAGARAYDTTCRLLNEASRVFKSGSATRPKIVFEAQEKTEGRRK